MKFFAALSVLLLVVASAFGANPSYQAFKGANGIVITTNPPNGDIIIDGSGISAGTNVPTSSSIPNRSMTNLLWSSTLFVDSTNGTNATAIRGDMSKPWRDVLVAMSNSASGDLIWARNGIHDIGSNSLVVLPGRKLFGQGFGTVIRGWGELQWNGPVIVPGSTSEVANLTIEHGGRNTYSGSTFGFHSGGTNFATHGPTNAYVHDVYMLGDTDCIYLRGTNRWDLTGWNIYAEAKFDSFVQFSESSNGVSRWNNCYFKVDLKGSVNPYSVLAGNATAVKIQGGTAEFIACSAIGTNGNLITRGFATLGGTTRWIGGSIEAAGTNDVRAAQRETAATFIYIGNQLRYEDIVEGVSGATVWGSEQSVQTNIIYRGVGLVFDDVDRLNDPVFISPSGGLNIGALTDPGASRLQVGSLPGSGDFVAADGNGKLFSTNAVSLGNLTNIVNSFFSSSTNASGLPFTNLLWGRTLFVDSEYGNDTTARRGDVSKPWLSAHIALTNATPGDIVYLREGIHDIGTNVFRVGHGVKVTGAGSGSVLQGQAGLLTNGPVVGLTGSTSEVSHITIQNTKREFYRTAAIGMFGAATNRAEGGTNMVIHDLTLIGTANTIYLRSTNSWTLRGWNLLAYSKWDCFSQFAESSNAVSRWNACYFESDLRGTTNTEAIAVGNANAIKVEGGVAEFIACDAVATNGASSGSTPATTALGATGGTTRWTGGNLKAAGTNDVKIIRNGFGNALIYVGNQLRIEDASDITWGSEQSIISNLVYTANGLVINDVDRLNLPILISSQGGVTIGNLTDPGPGRLMVTNLPGSGGFVGADATGLMFRTNFTGGGGSLVTNENQFAVNPTLNIKSGAALTGIVHFSTLSLLTNGVDPYVLSTNAQGTNLSATTALFHLFHRASESGTLRVGPLEGKHFSYDTAANILSVANNSGVGRFSVAGSSGNTATAGSLSATGAAWFGNTVSIPTGAISNYVWTCTNATTGMGEWRVAPGVGSTTPGGNSGDIQFNETGAFAGTNRLHFDRTNDWVTLTDIGGTFAGSQLRLNGYGMLQLGDAIDLQIGVAGASNWLIYGGTGIKRGGLQPAISNRFSIGSPTESVSNLFVNVIHAKESIDVQASSGVVGSIALSDAQADGSTVTLQGPIDIVNLSSVHALWETTNAGVVVELNVAGVTNKLTNVTLTAGQYVTYNGTTYVASNLPAAAVAGDYLTNNQATSKTFTNNGVYMAVAGAGVGGNGTNIDFAIRDIFTNQIVAGIEDRAILFSNLTANSFKQLWFQNDSQSTNARIFLPATVIGIPQTFLAWSNALTGIGIHTMDGKTNVFFISAAPPKTTNDFVSGQLYTNISGISASISAVIRMTNQTGGDVAKLALLLDEDGDGNFERTGINCVLSGGAFGTNTATFQLIGHDLPPGTRWTFTNQSAGTAGTSIEPNSSQWRRR